MNENPEYRLESPYHDGVVEVLFPCIRHRLPHHLPRVLRHKARLGVPLLGKHAPPVDRRLAERQSLLLRRLHRDVSLRCALWPLIRQTRFLNRFEGLSCCSEARPRPSGGFPAVQGLEGFGRGCDARWRSPVVASAARDLVWDLAHEKALRQGGGDGLGGPLAPSCRRVEGLWKREVLEGVKTTVV